MKKVMETLAGVALAAGLAAGAADEGRAAPFRIVTDGPDSVWVLDAGSGALTSCRLTSPSGPKIVDVFGDAAQTRDATRLRALPKCEAALAGAPEDARLARARAMLGDYGDASYGFFGDSDLRAGTWLGGLDQGIAIVEPRYVDVYVH